MNNIKYIMSGISFLIVGFIFLRSTVCKSKIINSKRRIMLKACSVFLIIIGLGMIICVFVLNDYKWNKMNDDWYYCLDKHEQINVVMLDVNMLKNEDFIMYQKDTLEKKGYCIDERKITENEISRIKKYAKSFYSKSDASCDLMIYTVSIHENKVNQKQFFVKNNSGKIEVLDLYISAVLQNKK
ncbi:hypothetical protein [Treponema sp.]|uniref:hypothetical protein n=1 Tax=Treponema sp. TaxID=166 RepID=UPI0025D01B47|nr:hypothetical protein [Treponema sp.]MCR5218954.1 hypothetical protein [Treponema sp.]